MNSQQNDIASQASSTNELVEMTATEVVGLLKKGEVTPLELVDAAAARIEAVEPQINALPIRFFDEARDAAKAFAAQKDHPGAGRPGWLAGLPVAVKDYNDVAGQITTYGSPIFAENRVEESDYTVVTLEESGGIPMAKSNVPEIAGANTFNPVFGATRNPWDLTRTVGGSSGGSACALGARPGLPPATTSAAACAFPPAIAASSGCAPVWAGCRAARGFCRSIRSGSKVRWPAMWPIVRLCSTRWPMRILAIRWPFRGPKNPLSKP